MLRLDGIHCYYGDVHVLKDVSLQLSPGEILCLLGRNGAGKTTTLRAIMGLVTPRSGRIALDGRELTGLRPHEIPRFGIGYVPQGRRIFPFLTVGENLKMGLLLKGSGDEALDWVLDLFPALRPRLRQRAGTLSGGEQQMLATARALCTGPKVLLMDEPSEGLMPTLIRRLLDTIRALKVRQVGVLLVEQKIDLALRVADRVALLENGSIRYESTPEALASNPEVLLRYLGVRR
ncbi:MAG: ABC transporter ATP-binding protein [Candidatus Rokubacteria bacterium RIFCSPLOWO2_02_FULL_68_19]|jgi:branched-chain amino acid transport system ATP-binding protein|nr:MAG: ABC transporter ATP-binding protein [Candidatus Rokubacteria bacterium RIFCSPLOWO2_02_FULL_68_19]